MSLAKYVKFLWIIPLVIAIVTLSIYLSSNMGADGEAVLLKGYMIVSDAGVPRGGFEWVGEYELDLEFNGDDGVLKVKQVSGLGDPLEKHVFNVDNLVVENDKLILVVEGMTYVFIYIETDEIWGKYNNTYTAIYSPGDGSFEIGLIDNKIFPGYKDHYYIEMHFYLND